jgi:predicted nucleotidyltransferase
MRRRFDSEYIESELQRVGRQLETELTVYLIGGGAMAFRGLKNTTKDIDLIVTDGGDLRVLQAVLLDNGYDIVKEPGMEYDDLGAQRILENDDGCRIDIFNQQVIDKLVLSEGMRRRSEDYLDAGGLSVALVSLEDIFLFKSVAGRTDDIEDMFALVQTELDFDVIEDELEQQIDLLGQELFVTHTNEALLELEDQHNISTPLADRVSEITERVYRELEVLQAFEGSISRSELEAAVDFSPDDVDDAIEHLTEKDVVTVEDDVIVRKSTNL